MSNIYSQLSRDALVKHALKRQEGVLASNGALTVLTGIRTGRSPKDRFIVKEICTEQTVDWGFINQPIALNVFQKLWDKAITHLHKQPDIFISDLQVGASQEYCLPVRVMTESAWQNLFVKNLFIDTEKLWDEKNAWQLLSVPTLETTPEVDGVNSNAALIICFSDRKVLLCGLHYAGEMKKAMFSVMNFLMPERDVLPMHCAANVGHDGSVALFFGLSGTGKTTLSADPDRCLIGDDEHGWSAQGVFNFEGGCYAKCINLSQQHEPLIFNAIKAGAIMENVVLNAHSEPDYGDIRYTENTRCAYPRSYIENCVADNQSGHPHAVIFLACDLYGVLPPVAKLTKEQAAYHFLSGYTALVGSTEVGHGSGIKTTFSACFGAPFFPRHAQVYADLLMKRLMETSADVYLVNTGWSGGAYANGGKRFSIPVTRGVVKAITSGNLRHTGFIMLPGFNIQIPKYIEGIDELLLDPRKTYASIDLYQKNLAELIGKFQENFSKFHVSDNIREAGPKNIHEK